MIRILKYLKKRLKTITSSRLENYYLSLDEISIYDFSELRKGKFQHVRKDKRKGNQESDFKAFERLMNEYLEKYSDKHFLNELEIKKRIIKMSAQFAITGDEMLLNYIAIDKASLVQKSGKEISLENILINFTRVLGLREIPNKKYISVTEFKEMEALCQSQLKSQK
jgi:hypothetical protein